MLTCHLIQVLEFSTGKGNWENWLEKFSNFLFLYWDYASRFICHHGKNGLPFSLDEMTVCSVLHSVSCIAQYVVYCAVCRVLHSVSCTAQCVMHCTVCHVLHSVSCTAQCVLYCKMFHVLHSVSRIAQCVMYFTVCHVLHSVSCIA